MTIDLAPTPTRPRDALPKAPTGIPGLDEVTGGGLPRGRPTLVSGAAGSGKTLLALEFLIHGALEHGEPGVLLTFEESAEDLAANVAALGYDLHQLEADGMLMIDVVVLDPAEIVETGAYSLEGLFIRLAYAVDAIGARRVVLDTIEVLFSALGNDATVRSELARLFRWLKERNMTAVVTGERGLSTLTLHGVEEYVSDCVIVLDQRVHDQLATRRLRVAKYRGSAHGTNEYPFLITERGIIVLPVTSLGLTAEAPTERMPTGVERLDRMLGGGPYRSSSTLVTGDAGTGKTTLCATFVDAACRRGERALFISFEESPAQVVRNMASVGIDLARWIGDGLLHLSAVRPASLGFEAHIAALIQTVDDFRPTVVALDAVTSLRQLGSGDALAAALTREIDFLKGRSITTIVSALSEGENTSGPAMVSSLMDTWLFVRNVESNGERNRLLYVRKSRGTAHSNQVRELVLSDEGVTLLDVPLGPDGPLTGSARLTQEAHTLASARRAIEEVELRKRRLARRTAEMEGQIEAARLALAEEVYEVETMEADTLRRTDQRQEDEDAMARQRWADPRSAEPSLEGSRS